jgi:hypothetical protein
MPINFLARVHFQILRIIEGNRACLYSSCHSRVIFENQYNKFHCPVYFIWVQTHLRGSIASIIDQCIGQRRYETILNWFRRSSNLVFILQLLYAKSMLRLIQNQEMMRVYSFRTNVFFDKFKKFARQFPIIGICKILFHAIHNRSQINSLGNSSRISFNLKRSFRGETADFGYNCHYLWSLQRFTFSNK